jgi:2,3-diketo-5-methylthiopentyl-1-phosphate enolase
MKNKMNSLMRLSESINKDKNLIATFYLRVPVNTNIEERATGIALEQTTGSWMDVPEETSELREKCAGKVIGIYEIPNYEVPAHRDIDYRDSVIKIAFPWENFGSNFPMMLSTIPGNSSYANNLKLIDLEFSESYIKNFKGPKFGIEGIRKLLGIKNRPLLLNMIKPCTGFSPEVGAELFEQVAEGGVDIIKDDELLGGSPSFSPIEKRVELYMRSCEKASKIKGEKTLYAVNITDRVDRLRENAIKAIKTGANALMINYIAVGLSATRMITEDPDINVPILGHSTMGGALCLSPFNGISSELVMAKLARIAGVDIVNVLVPYGKLPSLQEKYKRIVSICREPFYFLKKVFPNAVAGVYPGIVPQVIKDLGTDIILGAGAGIHGHPMGPKAGAIAMRVAIEVELKDQTLEEVAKNSPELSDAIKAWGVWKPESVSLFSRLRS